MANYIVRQECINKCYYLNYNKVQKLLQSGADYQAIPAKVSQEWPLYKDKKKGRNILVYTKQGISKLQLVKNQKILLSKSELFFESKINYDSHRTSKNCSSG